MNKKKDDKVLKRKLISLICLSIVLYFSSVLLYDELETTYGDISVPKRSHYEDSGLMNTYYQVIRDFRGNTLSHFTEKEDINIKLHALSAALIDGDNGRVLYEKEGNKQVAMASTTKIMTCIIALEYGNLNDIVTISKHAATMPDVQLNAMAGEKYTLKDLLYSLMLESHNDVAVAIAEHVGGSVEGFAKLMNDKAKELGCVDTNFVTPNGLDATGHLTTAIELARIAAYAIQNEDFVYITNTQNYTVTEQTKGKVFQINNKDRFLHIYDGAIGIKTGFTNKAGFCFVGAVKKNGKTFISSVLASGWPPNKNYKWQDTTNLMNYGNNHYKQTDIFYSEKEFAPIQVYEGVSKLLPIAYEGKLPLLMREDEQVRIVYQLPSYLKAPVEKNAVIGYANYYIGEELYEAVPILSMEEINDIDFEYCVRKIADIWRLR